MNALGNAVYLLAMRVLQSDLPLDEEERASADLFVRLWWNIPSEDRALIEDHALTPDPRQR